MSLVLETLTFFAAVVYPTHCSLKAIQSRSRDDSLQWLSYWMLHATLKATEELFESTLEWVPLYAELKFLFVLWAVAPQFKGATHLCERYVLPLLVKYEAHVGANNHTGAASEAPVTVDAAPALHKAAAFLDSYAKQT